jgi:hypothetical protein
MTAGEWLVFIFFAWICEFKEKAGFQAEAIEMLWLKI